MSELSEILSRYAPGYRAQHLDRVDEYRGFSGARIYRVETAVGKFALRCWPIDGLPTMRIRGLHRLLAHVRSLGIEQVSVPVRAEDGETLVVASSRRWQLEPWMPGTAHFHSHPNESRLIAAIDCLASFHRAAATFSANDAARQWFYTRREVHSPAVIERLERLRSWINEGSRRLAAAVATASSDEYSALAREYLNLSSRAADHVLDRLAAAARLTFPLQPCLRDIWHDHILFTGDEVTGLIDCSACRSDHVAIDLARMLGSLVGDDANAWKVALDAYVRHRRLSTDELNLVHVFDQSSVFLSPLTWFERRFVHNERFPNSQRVIQRLERYLGRLEALVGTI